MLDRLTIANRPAKSIAEWPIDVNQINSLPTPAVTAILLSANLHRLSEAEFKAIAAWFKDGSDYRRNINARSSSQPDRGFYNDRR